MTNKELQHKIIVLSEENYRLRFIIDQLRKETELYKDRLIKCYAEESKDLVIDDTHELAMVLMTKVPDLPLTTRAKTILKSADIKTLGDIVKHQKADFTCFRNCGQKTISDICNVVELYDLEWGMDVN